MNLKRSTTFHPETDGKTKVVNMTLVKIFRGYNQKHPKTWDENMVYIQHYYNRENYTSTGKSPFETGFGYFPPSPLDITYGKQGGVRETLQIRQIHL